MEKEATLSFSQLEQLEALHRHSDEPVAKSVATSILSQTNETTGDGSIIYETICNHRVRRPPDDDVFSKHRNDPRTPQYQCATCGTVWGMDGEVIEQNEIDGGTYKASSGGEEPPVDGNR